MSRSVPQTLKNRVLKEYEKGTDLKAISEKYGVSVPSINNWRREAGIDSRKTQVTPETIANVSRMYQSGKSMTEISESLGITTGQGYKLLKLTGISTRSKAGRPPIATLTPELMIKNAKPVIDPAREAEIMNSIGTQLKAAVRGTGMTVQAVADALGVCRKQVYRMFDGEPGVGIGFYIAAAALLGVDYKFTHIFQAA